MALLKRYANLEHYKDRHGKPRYYLRVKGKPRIPIQAPFGSVEFDREYDEARKAISGPTPEPGEGRTKPGTINALCVAYYKSADFKTLRPATQALYRRHIEAFRAEYGSYRVQSITKKHMRAIKDDMIDVPGACRNMLKRLTTLFNYAKEEDYITVNPMDGVRLPAPGEGFLAWSDEDIAHYLHRWPTGSRERLGLYLFLYLGQRRSDTARMGWHSVREVQVEDATFREIEVVQQKTGTKLWIPLHHKLEAELDLHPKDQAAFLIDRRTGKPLSGDGLGNWIREAAKLAGIEGTRGPHGLRKAACRHLIEAGCDTETARAISGHADDGELKTYIKSVNQVKMARKGIALLTGKG